MPAGNAVTLWKCIASDREGQTVTLKDIDLLAYRTLSVCLRLPYVLLKCCLLFYALAYQVCFFLSKLLTPHILSNSVKVLVVVYA